MYHYPAPTATYGHPVESRLYQYPPPYQDLPQFSPPAPNRQQQAPPHQQPQPPQQHHHQTQQHHQYQQREQEQEQQRLQHAQQAQRPPLYQHAQQQQQQQPQHQHQHQHPHQQTLPQHPRQAQGQRRKVQQPSRSFLGEPGYPEPSERSQEKTPFSAEDNAKLKRLKERSDPPLSWKQIGEFFPGRTYNTLQVHYCTKIKGVDIEWTRDLDKQLRTAVEEDEANKGKRIAKVLGGMFTAEQCEDRMKEIIAEGGNPKPYSKSETPDSRRSEGQISPGDTARKRTENGEAPVQPYREPASKRRCTNPNSRDGYSPRGKNGHAQPSTFWDTI